MCIAFRGINEAGRKNLFNSKLKVLGAIDMLIISPPVALANHNLNKLVIKIGIFLFAFGMLLPTDWGRMFGVLSEPVYWMSDIIPAIRKSAAISPIRELVQGFFGGAFLLMPFFLGTILRRDSINDRFKDALDNSPSKIRYFFNISFIVIPFFSLLLYLILSLPGEVNLGLTPTRGQAIFSLMVSYRFTLALFGSFVMLGICGILWFLTTLVAGPLCYFFERASVHGN